VALCAHGGGDPANSVDPALHQDGGDVSVIPSDEISNS
jgi:Fe-S cluster biogenesis protein NfuA